LLARRSDCVHKRSAGGTPAGTKTRYALPMRVEALEEPF
jgi:hypothetical protein